MLMVTMATVSFPISAEPGVGCEALSGTGNVLISAETTAGENGLFKP